MSKLALLAPLLVLSATFPATAREPVQVTSGWEDTIWYVDVETMRRDGAMGEAWVEVRHFTRDDLRLTERFLLSIDCVENRLRPVQVMSYAPGGALLRRVNLDEAEYGYEIFQPYTHAGSVARYICTGGGPTIARSGDLEPNGTMN